MFSKCLQNRPKTSWDDPEDVLCCLRKGTFFKNKLLRKTLSFHVKLVENFITIYSVYNFELIKYRRELFFWSNISMNSDVNAKTKSFENVCRRITWFVNVTYTHIYIYIYIYIYICTYIYRYIRKFW